MMIILDEVSEAMLLKLKHENCHITAGMLRLGIPVHPAIANAVSEENWSLISSYESNISDTGLRAIRDQALRELSKDNLLSTREKVLLIDRDFPKPKKKETPKILPVSRPRKKHYVLFNGDHRGIYDDLATAKSHVRLSRSVKWKGFNSKAEAEKAFKGPKSKKLFK